MFREVNDKPLVYLDNGASAQKPLSVIEAMDLAIGRMLAALNVVGTAEQLGDAAVQRKWLPMLLDAARELRPLL